MPHLECDTLFLPELREVDAVLFVSSGDVSVSDVEICKTSLIVDQELLAPQNHVKSNLQSQNST
jgi:hypothetical protein